MVDDLLKQVVRTLDFNSLEEETNALFTLITNCIKRFQGLIQDFMFFIKKRD